MTINAMEVNGEPRNRAQTERRVGFETNGTFLHLPSAITQNVWSAARLARVFLRDENSLRKCIRPLDGASSWPR